MTDVHVPVLIVGGGGAGLTASMLLSTYGVEHLLVSAHADDLRTCRKPMCCSSGRWKCSADVGCADRDLRAQHAGGEHEPHRLVSRRRRQTSPPGG